jgi:3-dehydroquinate synthase
MTRRARNSGGPAGTPSHVPSPTAALRSAVAGGQRSVTSSAGAAEDGLSRSGEAKSLGRGRMDWTDDGQTLAAAVTRQDTYPVLIGRGQLDTLPALVGRTLQTDSVFVVTDDTVAGLFLSRVADAFAARGLNVEPVVVPPGEPSKSWTAAQAVIEALLARGAKRRTVLVALGGGVVIDMVGFVASVFMRGLPYVNVPTSLIAQLDAAIGGKTGIDYGGSKNLLGAFYHPAAVLIDPDLLAPLPPREIRSGLAEAVKVGMLHPPLFAKLEKLRLGSPSDLDALAGITRDAVLTKMRLLRDDPFEQSLVRLLNLGHSVGHALEAATEFSVYRHGEAVAIGIAVATMISWQRRVCSAETRDRILACLHTCGLAVSLPLALLEATWGEIDVIRRIRNGALREVLPVSIGEFVVVDEIAPAEFSSAVTALAERAAVASGAVVGSG